MSNNWNQNNPGRGSFGGSFAASSNAESTVDDLELDEATSEEEVEAEVPAPVEAEEETEIETETDDAGEAESKGAKPKAGAKGISRAQVRRIAAKTVEVLDADEATRTVVSALVGSSTDAVELTSSIMVAPRTAKAPLNDIDELAQLIKDNEQFRAAISAGALAPAQRKAMWTALVAVNATTGTMPADTQKAVLELLKAITGLDADAQGTLEAAAELIKRS